MNNLVNRNLHKQSRIVWNFISNPLREVFRKFRHFSFHKISRFQSVRPRLQINRKSDRRLAVKGGRHAVILSAEFNPCHIF